MQTMKEVLTSFKGKRLNVNFENGVIEISLRPDSGPAYPYYAIQEVGSEVFKMTHKGAKQAGGVSRYYPVDRVLSIGPVTS